MDIYQRKSQWKLYLAISGFLIVLITIIYSNYLADRLKENEHNNVVLYAETLKSLSQIHTTDLNDEASLELLIVEKLIHIPVILESESGQLIGNNYGEEKDKDQEFLEKRKRDIMEKGFERIEGSGYSRYIYYENSQLYNLITYFPLVQVLLLGAFVALGYIGFSSARRAEQNRVWAGMAKETAHQLGTPISAIIAWIEHLKETTNGNETQEEIIGELLNDVDRLELIADRFSKIGSAPKLETVDVYQELQECKDYMQRRAPKGIVFNFPKPKKQTQVKINSHLFDWVIENLLRNALDAMEAKGKISVDISEETNMAVIELSDTGKGIPQNKFKTIFNPGYTTKKRGWGLGLSLAKRIIEEYHKGKIYVKQSKLDKGTTFVIKLPKAN